MHLIKIFSDYTHIRHMGHIGHLKKSNKTKAKVIYINTICASIRVLNHGISTFIFQHPVDVKDEVREK